MPTYVYQCQQCGTRFESLRSIKDSDSPIACNSCNSLDTHRCITACNMKTNSSGSKPGESCSSGCGGCHGGSCASCSH